MGTPHLPWATLSKAFLQSLKKREKIEKLHIPQILHRKQKKFWSVIIYFEIDALFNCLLNAP